MHESYVTQLDISTIKFITNRFHLQLPLAHSQMIKLSISKIYSKRKMSSAKNDMSF